MVYIAPKAEVKKTTGVTSLPEPKAVTFSGGGIGSVALKKVLYPCIHTLLHYR